MNGLGGNAECVFLHNNTRVSDFEMFLESDRHGFGTISAGENMSDEGSNSFLFFHLVNLSVHIFP